MSRPPVCATATSVETNAICGRLEDHGGVDAVNWGGLTGGHPSGVVGNADLASGFATVRRAQRAAGHPRSEAARAPGHTALGRAGSPRTVGDGRGARIQPWRQLCAKVDWSNCGAAARRRQTQHTRRSDLGDPHVRGRAHREHGAGRVADRSHRGPWHLPHPAARGLASTTASAGVIFAASLVGAPTSTSQVVASSLASKVAGGAGATFIGTSPIEWASPG